MKTHLPPVYRLKPFHYLNPFFFTITLLTILLAAGCRDDEDITVIETGQDDPIVTEGAFAVAGRVITETGFGLSGVTVESLGSGASVVTDPDGYYRFEAAPLPTTGAILTFHHDILFDEYRYFLPGDGGAQTLDVTMKRVPTTGDVNALTGGTVQTGNLQLTIPGGVALLNGAAYSGSIEIKMTFEDPTNSVEMLQSGISFPGVTPDGDRVVLGSLGTVQIQLTGDMGLPVTLSEGATALLSVADGNAFPERNNAVAWMMAPEGWVETSSPLTITPSEFSVDVPGKGYYQFAVSYPTGTVCGRLLDQNLNVLSGTPITITLPSGLPLAAVPTLQDGRFCLPAAAGLSLTAKIGDPCFAGNDLTVELGSVSDTDLGDLSVEYGAFVRQVHVDYCPVNNELFGLDLPLYIDGVRTENALSRNNDLRTFTTLTDCDGDGNYFVQFTDEDGLASSNLYQFTASAPPPAEGLGFEICSFLESEEQALFTVEENSFSATEGGFLLLNAPAGLRQRIWAYGTDGDGGEYNLLVDYPVGPPETYTANQVNVTLELTEADGSRFSYACDDCALNLTTNNLGLLGPSSGSLLYSGEKVDLDSGETISDAASVFVDFRILH